MDYDGCRFFMGYGGYKLKAPYQKKAYQVLPLTKTFLATKNRMNHIQFKIEFEFSMFTLRRITL